VVGDPAGAPGAGVVAVGLAVVPVPVVPGAGAAVGAAVGFAVPVGLAVVPGAAGLVVVGAGVAGLVCPKATDDMRTVRAMVATAPQRTRIVDVSSMLFSQPALESGPRV
jgi:hypothetical protein